MVLQRIKDEKLVAVIRTDSAEDAILASERCIDAGVRVIEVTFTIPDAESVIKTLCKKYNNDDSVVIGAGTVLDSETARIAILAGAKFIVSPITNPEMISLCHRYHVVSVAGAFTPNEVYAALNCGVNMIKIFPGSNASPTYIKDLRGPFPNTCFMVTGNVNFENVADWISNGVSAVGVGTVFVKYALSNDIDTLKSNIKTMRESIARGVK